MDARSAPSPRERTMMNRWKSRLWSTRPYREAGRRATWRFVSLPALIAAAIALTSVWATPLLAADDRVALVIGNNAYPGNSLNNPVNDARQVAKALTELGFKVVIKTDVDFTEMRDAVVSFSNLLDNNNAAVFYFSGHGIQYRGKNYLVPIDAKLKSEAEVVFNALEVMPLLERMKHANVRHKFLILDACRENRFGAGSASGAAKGLAKMNIPPGTTVALAAQADAVAAGGKGDEGVYTRNLLREIRKPGIHADLMLQQVSQGVQSETLGRQSPEVQSVAASAGNFFFNQSPSSGPATGASTGAVETKPRNSRASADTEAKVDLEFWSTVKDSSNADDFRAYLQQFRNGRFATLARNRIDGLTRQATPARGIEKPPPEMRGPPTIREAAPETPVRVASISTAPQSNPALGDPVSGTIEFAGGARYNGHYRVGSDQRKVPHGMGEYSDRESRYVGEFKDGRKHGRGLHTWANGDSFNGEFADDLPNGKGAYRFAGGDRYEGEMAAGRMSGKGIYTSRSLDRIEATFRDGKADGEGICYFANNDRYEGQMKSGALTGKGKYFYANGLRAEGEFVDGRLHGNGRFYFNDGSWFEGEFEGGLKNAKGFSYTKDGTGRAAVIVDNVVRIVGG